MDNSLVKDAISAFVKANIMPLSLGIGGLMFLVYGLISLSPQKEEKQAIVFEANQALSPAQQSSTQSQKKRIIVDVEGAVQKPGIYPMEADSRVNDALIMAGGMSKEADRDKVTKFLNLAAKLVDGGKIYIPFMGEAAMATSGQGSEAVLGTETGSGSINLNTSSQKELESLPGIGEVTAKKIMDARPFSSIEELTQKKIVGQKVYGQIKDKVSVY